MWRSLGVCSWKGSALVLRALIWTTKKSKKWRQAGFSGGQLTANWAQKTKTEIVKWKMQLKGRQQGPSWQEANMLRQKGSLAKDTLWREMFTLCWIQTASIHQKSNYLEILKSEMKDANVGWLHYTAKPGRRRITQ